MKNNETYKIRGVIFGSLYPNKIHIHVGYNIGMMDGGGLLMVDTNQVPIDCRMPNTLVWITSNEVGYENITIKKMTDPEAVENKIEY
ncbi:hypothetical protein [uncultured Dokdonia sp.]|uniref:hypothetical protein n=1 Tax=uncultured Dokdonia sp. TaxID=575653 RepID=UPI002601B399|nr:hypothetical protein [uncultured Dokdonia sp.]